MSPPPAILEKENCPGLAFFDGNTFDRSWHRGRNTFDLSPRLRLTPEAFFVPAFTAYRSCALVYAVARPKTKSTVDVSPSSCRARQSERRHYFFVRRNPRGAWAPPALLCRLRPHNPSQPTRKPLAQTAVYRTHPPHISLLTVKVQSAMILKNHNRLHFFLLYN